MGITLVQWYAQTMITYPTNFEQVIQLKFCDGWGLVWLYRA